MKNKLSMIFLSFILIFVNSCQRDKSVLSFDNEEATSPDTIKVVYAGVRSSNYGINPFPAASGWENAMKTMSGYFPGSTPCAIWIVGVMDGSKTCHLEFPSDGNHYSNISFRSTDKHEAYLSHFDESGIKVYLQVESANADMEDLINLVLTRYQSHRCVAGFGVDVEWYREAENPGWGVKVTDALAQEWETQVKSYNDDYQLFLKHWDRDWMPPNYRNDIIFVDDSQMFNNVAMFIDEFTNYWADYFYPNLVFFQIGYRADKAWWQTYETPPKDLGELLAEETEQQCGIFWVDFTLQDVLPVSDIVHKSFNNKRMKES